LLNNDPAQQNSYAIPFARHDFILAGAGALYWPALGILVVSDLHLEKGSYFASLGQPLPVYDTMDTLERLAKIIAVYQPTQVIALGDNMHDAKALQRMLPADLQRLEALCSSVSQWSWIVGNHDKDDYSVSVLRNMNFHVDLRVAGVVFSHDFLENVEYQIIGHYHPKITVKTKVQSIHGKCFITTDKKILMPAFGSYTGGLDVGHAIFKPLVTGENPKYFLLRQNMIWRVK
jgi:DNA ligase-associated metallophosphoesterase